MVLALGTNPKRSRYLSPKIGTLLCATDCG